MAVAALEGGVAAVGVYAPPRSMGKLTLDFPSAVETATRRDGWGGMATPVTGPGTIRSTAVAYCGLIVAGKKAQAAAAWALAVRPREAFEWQLAAGRRSDSNGELFPRGSSWRRRCGSSTGTGRTH